MPKKKLEKGEKFLPIGSVVMLENGTKKVMITGFCAVEENNRDKMWDYTGCIYPEGYMDSKTSCLFDHDKIKEVFFIGYQDDEEKSFKDRLNEVLKSM